MHANHFSDYLTPNQRMDNSVFLKIDDSSRHIDLALVTKRLKRFNVKRILLYGTISDIEMFLQQGKSDLAHLHGFEFSVIFKPDLYTFLKENISKIENFLLKRLFCNVAYFKRHLLLSQDVFHFFDSQPEVLTVRAQSDPVVIDLPHAEDVDSLFLLANSNKGNIYEEVTEVTRHFNPLTGKLSLPLKRGKTYRLIVLRKYYFDQETDISHAFNYYDATPFAALQKWFKKRLLRLPVPVNGVVYHLEEMFDVTQKINGVYYSANLEKVLHGIKKTIAFYYANNPNGSINNIFLSIVLKRYFNSMLRPRFNIISPSVRYVVAPDSSLTRIMDVDHQFLIELDMERFEPHTPYYWKAVATLKRAQSQLFAENQQKLPVIAHCLMQSHFSIPEQKVHIDLLHQAGASQIWWKDKADNTVISEANGQFILKKLGYANHLSTFLAQGLPVSEVLILYPSLDQNQQGFLDVLKELYHAGINFELIDYDLFNSNHLCKIEGDKLVFNQKSYRLLLLPAIQVIPILTMDKLLRFFNEGGHIAAIQKIPVKVELRERQRRFEALRKKLWLVEPDMTSITFIKSAAGGKSYFIPKLSLLKDFIQPYLYNQPVFAQANTPFLVHIRETHNAFLAFVSNISKDTELSVELLARGKWQPSEWNAQKNIREAIHFWHFEGGKLRVPLHLFPLESRLIVLEKNSGSEPWHVSACPAGHCHIEAPEPEAFIVYLHHERPATIPLNLTRHEEMIKIPLQISETLRPIFITPDHWVLKAGNKKQILHLDDLRKVIIEPETTILLQKTFVLGKFQPNFAYFLDLGLAPHPCKIHINGQSAGLLWFHPFRTDISKFLRTGENTLEIEFIGPVGTKAPFVPSAGYVFHTPIKIVPYQKFYIRAEDYSERSRQITQ